MYLCRLVKDEMFSCIMKDLRLTDFYSALLHFTLHMYNSLLKKTQISVVISEARVLIVSDFYDNNYFIICTLA